MGRGRTKKNLRNREEYDEESDEDREQEQEGGDEEQEGGGDEEDTPFKAMYNYFSSSWETVFTTICV